MGRNEEAIQVQEKAVELANKWAKNGGSEEDAKGYATTLEKMKKGIQTWPDFKKNQCKYSQTKKTSS